MVASQLNHQIILLLEHPLTHYWTSPFNNQYDTYLIHGSLGEKQMIRSTNELFPEQGNQWCTNCFLEKI